VIYAHRLSAWRPIFLVCSDGMDTFVMMTVENDGFPFLRFVLHDGHRQSTRGGLVHSKLKKK
jgi:hypothetical protein